MRRTSFLRKLYAAYVVLVVLTTGLVGLLVGNQLAQVSLQETKDRLRSEATLLDDIAKDITVAANDPAWRLAHRSELDAFQARVKRLGSELGTRLTVILQDGSVIADSERTPANMDNHATRPEVQEAIASGVGKTTRFSETVQIMMMYVAQPIAVGGARVGFARTAIPLTVHDERIRQLFAMVAIAAVLAATMALVVGFFFARYVTRPLGLMTSAAQAIAGGDYRKRVERTSTDEIGQLAEAFNAMADELEDRMLTISKDRQGLLAILGSMAEGVIAVGGEQRVTHMNTAAGRMLQVSPAQSVGRKLREVTRVAEIRRSLSDTLQQGREAQGEVELRDGRVSVMTRTTPLLDGAGELDGAVIVMQDVTELRRMETIRRDFVANVSHELKTPIAAIRGVVETVLDDPEMKSGIRTRFLKKARNQSHRLSNLVTDILSLSRYQSQEAGLKRSIIDIREPVQQAARNHETGAEEKGIAMQMQISELPICIRGEAEALQLAVSNLLDNAVKYTAIKSGNGAGRIWVRVFSGSSQAFIEVEDTGIGIAPEEQERIFERFYRIDKARSRELGGTGLGLAIVKHICLSMDGLVAVSSEPARGCLFRISLPVVSESEAAALQYALPLQPSA